MAKTYLKLQRQREAFARKTANALVSSHDLIALEDLQIRNLVKHRRLAKALSDASWGRFRRWVEYYGRVQQVPVLAVPPHSTSQRCSGCGELVRQSSSVRTHICPSCGLVLDRDHNAAVVIREAGLARAIGQGVWDPVRHRVLVCEARGTVGHTDTETRGDRRAPAGDCEAVRCPGWRNQASPGFSRGSVNRANFDVGILGGYSMETPLSPLEFMRRARRLYPTREAVVDEDVRLTYEEFGARCDRWSAALLSIGVRQGDRVAYIAPNTHAQLESFYAVPQLGAVLVPINYRLAVEDFAYIIGHSGAQVVCVHSDYLESVEGIRAALPTVQHFIALEGLTQPLREAGWLDYEEMLTAASGAFPRPTIAESDLLTINYTSGTTSRPKGVMITHRNAYLNAIGTLIHISMSPADRYLWTLPMFHANGWTFVWIVTAAGGTHLCLRKVEPRAVFTQIRDERATLLCAAPTVLISIANAPEDVRRLLLESDQGRQKVRVLTAGAPPAAATIERIEGELGWEITHVYGLTETSPFITICEPRPEHASLSPAERATIKARQGVELITSGELLVIDDQGNEVPHDGATLGEIVARGNVVMKGYFNDPDATARAFEGGWFHSGDAAVVHPDGYVEIRDRLKDVIISGGENISSVEVEGIILRHPAVQEVAVVGLSDAQWGESPHAFVVLKGDQSTTEEELRSYAREHMAHFKVPKSFTLVAELPKTATGKIQKYVLRGGKVAIARQ